MSDKHTIAALQRNLQELEAERLRLVAEVERLHASIHATAKAQREACAIEVERQVDSLQWRAALAADIRATLLVVDEA